MTKDTTPVAPKAGVSYRVLKRGEGLIYTGEHAQDENGQIVFTTYAKGAQVDDVDPKVAAELEDRALVEILG